MPLSTQTLTWETVATFVVHLVIPIAIGIFVLALKINPVRLVANKALLLPWIFLFVVISFFVNLGFLSRLQIDACSGIKDWTPIFLGALKSVAITVPLTVLPLFSEWLRLLISQVWIRPHLPLAAPGQVKINEVTVTAADIVEDIATGAPAPTQLLEVMGIGGVLEEEAYHAQTFQEWGRACAYMSAFGGAIGFAVGSWGVANCRGGDRNRG